MFDSLKSLSAVPFLVLGAFLFLISCSRELAKPEPPGDVMLYGGERNDAFYDALALPSGDFILCGTTQTAEENYDLMILRTGGGGIVLDSFALDLNQSDVGERVIPFQSGYAVLGYAADSPDGNRAYFILMLDQDLQVTATLTDLFFAFENYSPLGFDVTPDGNFLIALIRDESQAVIKVGPAGNVIEERTFPVNFYGPSGTLLARLDSATWVTARFEDGIKLTAFDQNLDYLWETSYTPAQASIPWSLLVSHGKIYVSSKKALSQFRVLKFSGTGVFENEFAFGEGRMEHELAADENGSIWLGGKISEGSGDGAHLNVFLMSMDSLGNFSNPVQLEGERDELVNCLAISPAGVKLLGGSTDSFGADNLAAFTWMQ